MQPEVRAKRQATIDRAVRLMDGAHPDDVAHWIAQCNFYDHVKANPAKLRDDLASTRPDDETPKHFANWKAAQQILQAAGLPY